MNWSLIITIVLFFLAGQSIFNFFEKRRGIRKLVYCLLVQRGFSSLEELIEVTDKINVLPKDTINAVNYLSKHGKVRVDYSTPGQVYFCVDDALN